MNFEVSHEENRRSFEVNFKIRICLNKTFNNAILYYIDTF